jgi:hypothetical protein
MEQYRDVIENFFRIAERRVRVLDEYGDENWKAVDKEILRCIDKLGERSMDRYRPSDHCLRYKGNDIWKYELARNLLGRFKVYHDLQLECQVTSSQP